jgi:hypothetical protein
MDSCLPELSHSLLVSAPKAATIQAPGSLQDGFRLSQTGLVGRLCAYDWLIVQPLPLGRDEHGESEPRLRSLTGSLNTSALLRGTVTMLTILHYGS